jgi:hypothetical protein
MDAVGPTPMNASQTPSSSALLDIPIVGKVMSVEVV